MRKTALLSTFLIVFLASSFLLPSVSATEIFSDGFESGDFSAWSGTSTTSGETTSVGTQPHHGDIITSDKPDVASLLKFNLSDVILHMTFDDANDTTGAIRESNYDLEIGRDSERKMYYPCYFNGTIDELQIRNSAGGEEYSFELSETCAVTASLATQKNLYRSTFETVEVTSIIETQKTITLTMFAEISQEIVVSGVLETVKHISATLIELTGTLNLSALHCELLPYVTLSTDELLGLVVVFFVIGLACSIALVVALRKK